MKILYYSSHPNLNLSSPSGYGTHMREMIAAFEAEGHEVRPVIMGGTTIDNGNLAIKGRGVLKNAVANLVPKYIWESAKDYRLLQFDNYAKQTLEAEIDQFQPDLMYERAAYLQTSGVSVAKKKGIKHVLEVNSPCIEERKVLQGNSFFINQGVDSEKKLLEDTDKVIVVSSALKEHFGKVYHIPESKFIVTPNAINPELLQYDNTKTDKLKDKLNLNQETVIGFVGSIFPWHGVDLLIEAFAKLVAAENSAAHLLIVGDGEILPLLKEKVISAGVADKVTFTGNVLHSEVFNYIELMDVCVSPKSHWYGSPVKIFEYGAMGKAIVAPDNIPVRDVMTHKETGLLTNSTSESLYQALKLYLEDNTLRQKCATSFKAKVLSEHTWHHNAIKVLQSLS